MKLNEVTALALRICGVYILITAFSNFPILFSEISITYRLVESGLDSQYTYLSLWASSVSLLLCGLFLTVFPVTVAKWILPKSTESSPAIEGDSEVISIAAFTVLGIYVLSYALPDLLYNFHDLYIQKKFGPGDDESIYEVWLYQVNTIVEISIGLYLALGSKGLYSVISKLRG